MRWIIIAYTLDSLIEYVKNSKKSTSTIPFNDIEYEDARIYPWLAKNIELELDNVIAYADYLQNYILVRRVDMAVTNSWTLIIPYAKRNDYVDMVAKINSLVDNNGIVALFVCNVPYDLHSYLVVESDTNAEQINSLIKQYNIELDNEVGFTELFMEIANKKYNNHSFAPDDDKELIQLAFNSHYQFHSDSIPQSTAKNKRI